MRKLRDVASRIEMPKSVYILQAHDEAGQLYGGDYIRFYRKNETPTFPQPENEEEAILISLINSGSIYTDLNEDTKKIDVDVEQITRNGYDKMCDFMMRVYTHFNPKKITRRSKMYQFNYIKYTLVTSRVEDMYLAIKVKGINVKNFEENKEYLKPFALEMKKLGEEYGNKA